MTRPALPTHLTGGLFTLGCRDCHALLGVPLTASGDEVRRGYLRIARRPHPDSNRQFSPEQRQLATAWLSRWVNPAYAQLIPEARGQEYLTLLQTQVQHLQTQDRTLRWRQGQAPDLLTAAQPESAYRERIAHLGSDLFRDLDTVADQLADLSELNLAWLLRQSRSSVSPAPTESGDQLERYLQRAEGYLRQHACAQAQLELRDALRLAPQDSRVHALNGLVYLELAQPSLARVSIRRALQLDPQQALAQEGKQRLEQQGHRIDLAPGDRPPDSRSGNWFTGLFSRRS